MISVDMPIYFMLHGRKYPSTCVSLPSHYLFIVKFFGRFYKISFKCKQCLLTLLAIGAFSGGVTVTSHRILWSPHLRYISRDAQGLSGCQLYIKPQPLMLKAVKRLGAQSLLSAPFTAWYQECFYKKGFTFLTCLLTSSLYVPLVVDIAQ